MLTRDRNHGHKDYQPVFRFVFGSSGHAGASTVITSGCVSANSCTMQELFAGGSIQVEDHLFHNWVLSAEFGTSGTSDLSQVIVSGLDDQAMNAGIRVEPNGEWSATAAAGQTNNYFLSYFYNALVLDPGLRIHGASMEITGTATGGVDSWFQTDMYVGPVLSTWITSTANPLPSKTFDQEILFSSETSLSVWSPLRVWADGGTTNVDRVDQRFSLVPEPISLALFSLGLVGIGYQRRRCKTA